MNGKRDLPLARKLSKLSVNSLIWTKDVSKETL